MPKLGNQVDFISQERTGSIYIHFRQLLLKKIFRFGAYQSVRYLAIRTGGFRKQTSKKFGTGSYLLWKS